MANIKLNSKRNEPKKFKIRRHNALKHAVNTDNSKLKPGKNLNAFGRAMFKSIVKNNKQLSNSDEYLINVLSSQYQIYIQMTNYITKHGAVDSNGKRSAQFQILKATIDQIIKLSNQLNITPKNRISADFHAQDQHDPVKAVFR